MFGVQRNIRRIKKGVQLCPFRRKFGTVEKEVRYVTDRILYYLMRMDIKIIIYYHTE